MLPAMLTKWTVGDTSVQLFVPDPGATRKTLGHEPANAIYWAKLWPSAIALAGFLDKHHFYFNNKNVLELAAGLGLPGLFAAKYATRVTISDRDPRAVELVEKSATANGLTNISALVIDWTDLSGVELPDTLLLSDINYEPEYFDQLYTMLLRFIKAGVTVVLSTPQRLTARDFISRLLRYSKSHTEEIVIHNGEKTIISVFILSE